MATKVLLVEDDPIVQRMYVRALQSSGFEVTTANDGEQGVAVAPTLLPDIILMDVMMPKMNGLDALKAIKENEATKPIPIIMLTAYEEDDKVIKALNLGAIRYIVKSNVDPVAIIDIINDILAQSKEQPAQ